MSSASPISVVVPVFNGAAWIGATLDSLMHQEFGAWEAVVVNDGSTDDTVKLVEEYASRDVRIRLVSKANGGVSSARNTGTEAARYPWLLYLDGDDLLSPRYLLNVAWGLASNPAAIGAVTTWVRLLPDGRLFNEKAPEHYDDLFEIAARYCPFAVHACVVQRDLVLRVGGWDTSLVTCEDWDLWARLARTGGDFVPVSDALAVYRSRASSASYDGRRMLTDGIEVLGRTHGHDQRVPASLDRRPLGADAKELDRLVLQHASWCAGLEIGQGADVSGLLDAVDGRTAPMLDPGIVAGAIERAGYISSLGRPLCDRWNDSREAFGVVLDRLEKVSGSPRLAARSQLLLARSAADSSVSPSPIDLGSMLSVPIDACRDLPTLTTGDGVDRVRLRVTADGESLGHVELSSSSGEVDALLIHEAIADQLAMPLLQNFIRKAVIQPERRREQRIGPWQDNVIPRFIKELWDVRRSGDLPPMFCGVSEDIELSEPLGDLVVRKNGPTDLALSLGGLPVVTFRIAPRSGAVTAGQLRATVTRHAMPQLIRATVSAGILGRPTDDHVPLRERLRLASAASVSAPGEVRHIQVPVTPAWWLSWRESRPDPARRVRSMAVRLPPTQRRFVKRLYLQLASMPGLFGDLVPGSGQTGIPILMYHRVAPGGPLATARWRVTPQQFAGQLAALSNAGYTGVSLEQLRSILFEGALPPRRPVVLTFDDGYQDFADHAWPALQARGFSATMFVVAGEVGRSNRWDDVFDDPAPLMDWDTLTTLTTQGLELGSHSLDHPAMTALTSAQIRSQAERSKAMIEDRTGVVVRSFAYPYGDYDDVVAELVHQAGYDMAVTCDHGPMTVDANPRRLPRLEVTGSMSPRALVSEVGRLRT